MHRAAAPSKSATTARTPLAERLTGLTDWLAQHRRLWSPRPFTRLPVSWEADHPDVARSLRELSESQVSAFEARPWDLPDMPEAFQGWASQARAHSQWLSLSNRSSHEPGPRPRLVPGRKWDQISHFASTVLLHTPADLSGWLDWCSGKGHLGRLLAVRTDRPVVCVEQQEHLCDQGDRLASDPRVDAGFVQANVLNDPPLPSLSTSTGLVALHACGRLHTEALLRGSRAGCSLIGLAPCCYHRYGPDRFEPLSRFCKDHDLDLAQRHLRLVAFEEVVASPGRRKLRRQEQAWRLGFDLLQREVTGENRYRPGGPIESTWLRGSFRSFCSRLAEREGIDLPLNWKPESWEKAGWERGHVVRALSLVRSLFRRPLEGWLVMDRALFLEEHGYRVRVGTFCPPQVTPRNLMVLATRR